MKAANASKAMGSDKVKNDEHIDIRIIIDSNQAWKTLALHPV